MQDGCGRHGARAHLGRRGPQRIRGLQRVSPLHALPTLRAVPNVDGKRAHQGPHRRHLFLILHRDGRLAHGSRARWTDGRERGVVGFVNLGRNGPVRATAIGRSGLAAGASRVLRRPVLGKRRGLSESCTPCGLEFLAQALVVASQPFVLPPQRIAFLLGAFGALAKRVAAVRRFSRVRRPRIRHVDVMPDPRQKYKYDLLDRSYG